MLKWIVILAAFFSLLGYVLINNEPLLRKGLDRVKLAEGQVSGDDFLRFKYNPDTAAYFARFNDPLSWRCRISSVAMAFGDYELVHQVASEAHEIHKEGPLALSEGMQQLDWDNARSLDMLGKVSESKEAFRGLLKDFPDHPQKEAAKQRLAELEMYR